MLAVDIVLTGLIIGGIYALTALGLTLQYGVARIMNLSYGEFVVAAALTTYWLYTAQSTSPLIGLVVIVPLAFAFNWLVYQLVLHPLVRRARNEGMLEVDSILATFGLLFVIQGIARGGLRRQLYQLFLSVDPGSGVRQRARGQPPACARVRGRHRSCDLSGD